jgi:hypothetical protein
MAWDGFVCLDLLVVMLAFGLPGPKAGMSDASQSTWNGKLVVASVGALFLVGSWWALPQWLWWTCLHVYVPPPPNVWQCSGRREILPVCLCFGRLETVLLGRMCRPR